MAMCKTLPPLLRTHAYIKYPAPNQPRPYQLANWNQLLINHPPLFFSRHTLRHYSTPHQVPAFYAQVTLTKLQSSRAREIDTIMDTIPPASAATVILVCANLSARCANAANLTCSGCHLVKVNPHSPCSSHTPTPNVTKYCCKECQRAHWTDHKPRCKSSLAKENWEPSWVANKRLPAFVTGNDGPPAASFGMNKYLWGNMPSYDHINLAQNEGKDWNKPFHLCFAG
jgi:hypothetical protein